VPEFQSGKSRRPVGARASDLLDDCGRSWPCGCRKCHPDAL